MERGREGPPGVLFIWARFSFWPLFGTPIYGEEKTDKKEEGNADGEEIPGGPMKNVESEDEQREEESEYKAWTFAEVDVNFRFKFYL